MRRRSLGGKVLVTALALLLPACGGVDAALRSQASDDEPEAPLDGAAVLEALRGSLVFIETPFGTGSGLVTDDGYVLTNAHVVDPFAAALVTPVDGTGEEVPVVGADLFADIAVLGPLEQDAPTAPLAVDVEPATGSDVFLLGFPGDVPGVPEPTIARGILSRVRPLEEFELTYLQTDAAIGAGQSGGALVDDRGRILGISGLAYAEEFALALSSEDTSDALGRILDGEATPYTPLPDEPLVTSTTFTLPWRYDTQVLLIPAADAVRRVEVTVPDDPGVTLALGDLLGNNWVMNAAAVQEELAYDPALTAADAGRPTAPVAPGTWEVELPAGSIGAAYVGARRDGAELSVSANESFVVVPDRDQGVPLEPGDRVEATLDGLELTDSYLLELDAGQTVDVGVRSPSADMWFEVVAPNKWAGEAEHVDDSGGGLYGMDAEGPFTAEVAGTHRLLVGTWDGVAVGYVVEVG